MARVVNSLWALQAARDVSGSVAATFIPGFRGTISVSVVGGPEANMRRIWYLACATIFGRYRNCPTTIYQQIEFSSTWDISKKAVRIDLSYRTNALSELLSDFIGPALALGLTVSPVGKVVKVAAIAGVPLAAELVNLIKNAHSVKPDADAWSYLHRGPEQLTVGASWPAWARGNNITNADGITGDAGEANWTVRQLPPTVSQKVAISPVGWRTTLGLMRELPFMNGEVAIGYPYGISCPGAGTEGFQILPSTDNRFGMGDAIDGATPVLPDCGRIITTIEKRHPRMPAPTPPVDGATRGSLVALVAQSLASPCYLPDAPATDTPAVASSGIMVWQDYKNRTLGQMAGLNVGPDLKGNGVVTGPVGPRNTGSLHYPEAAESPVYPFQN